MMQRKPPTTIEEQRPCLLVQTTDGWLKILDACSGECLRSAFVSSIIKFSSLDWADYYHTIQLKSTVSQIRRSGSRGLPPPTSDRLMIMYIFKIHPLQLAGSFSLNRSVFGAKIRDAELSEDVLVVSHSNNTFNFYSFRWMLKHCTVLEASLGEWLEMDGGGRCGIVGEPGFGVPLTMNIKECPPLLFTTQSSLGYGVQFGGSPAVFCHNSVPKFPDVFHIRALSGRHLVAELKNECPTMNDDVANFHFDNYQRFIHIHGCTYSSYKIRHADGQPHRLEKQYSVDFKQQSPIGYQLEQQDTPVITLSGRVVKRRSTDGGFNDLSSSLHKVELEDEVDLVFAVVTLPAGDDDVSAYLFFLDDKTGTILKTVEIPTWKQGLSNLIDYELDCILHVVQDGATSTCHYYRLTRTKR
ncbi:DDB1- and CUL4-associated factor 17 [Geodia barretti]|uniref:DDB1- and CUL4-associated factor 17 n=1 Tax=Geodia barretti TaxID=519541 RepID=A0AA35THK1_GEOBA|nr:DDB1- and CUL4-associated factor 17 [Geodia barretti]